MRTLFELLMAAVFYGLGFRSGKTYVKARMTNAIRHKRIEWTHNNETSDYHIKSLDNIQSRVKDA